MAYDSDWWEALGIARPPSSDPNATIDSMVGPRETGNTQGSGLPSGVQPSGSQPSGSQPSVHPQARAQARPVARPQARAQARPAVQSAAPLSDRSGSEAWVPFREVLEAFARERQWSGYQVEPVIEGGRHVGFFVRTGDQPIGQIRASGDGYAFYIGDQPVITGLRFLTQGPNGGRYMIPKSAVASALQVLRTHPSFGSVSSSAPNTAPGSGSGTGSEPGSNTDLPGYQTLELPNGLRFRVGLDGRYYLIRPQRVGDRESEELIAGGHVEDLMQLLGGSESGLARASQSGAAGQTNAESPASMWTLLEWLFPVVMLAMLMQRNRGS